MNETLATFSQQWQPQLNSFIEQQVNATVTQETLRQSMCYSLMAGGKRLRPLLYLATVATFAEIQPSDLQAAASIELIHTYSLIHDDLPAMDNDDYRRGQLTNHKQFGEAMAILAGDGLLTLAFQWVGELASKSAPPLPTSAVAQMVTILAQAAGPSGMVAGQVIDIEATGKKLPNLAMIQELDALKTGALLTAPLQMAAVRLQLAAQPTQALIQFGRHFGVAFQIYDDLLDYAGTEAELGKEVHKDVAAGKNTYPEFLGIAGAKAKLHAEISAAQTSLNDLAADVEPQLLLSFLSYFDKDSGQ
ncbi:polyprenyl synthetase family protein [Lapidilactobacillus bayanensis]|uniref:polyprenyl synthetase family protein n=1 Tax=Lapidilactobacillus bayanensis TaxID=2485998 RepID=UPI001CDC0EA1|nr:farnesyl diphosphate synthase [Lapidilactobacillus bayanensis]